MLKNSHTIHCATGIPTKKHPRKTASLHQYAIPITEHVRVLCPCLRQKFADWDACDSFFNGGQSEDSFNPSARKWLSCGSNIVCAEKNLVAAAEDGQKSDSMVATSTALFP